MVGDSVAGHTRVVNAFSDGGGVGEGAVATAHCIYKGRRFLPQTHTESSLVAQARKGKSSRV